MIVICIGRPMDVPTQLALNLPLHVSLRSKFVLKAPPSLERGQARSRTG